MAYKQLQSTRDEAVMAKNAAVEAMEKAKAKAEQEAARNAELTALIAQLRQSGTDAINACIRQRRLSSRVGARSSGNQRLVRVGLDDSRAETRRRAVSAPPSYTRATVFAEVTRAVASRLRVP